jgi:hypothetical protein
MEFNRFPYSAAVQLAPQHESNRALPLTVMEHAHAFERPDPLNIPDSRAEQFRCARPESAPQCCSDGISDSWPAFWTDPIGEERIVERIRELEAPGIGKISFRLDKRLRPRKNQGAEREMVLRY